MNEKVCNLWYKCGHAGLNCTSNVTMTNDQRLLGSNALDEGDKNMGWSS